MPFDVSPRQSAKFTNDGVSVESFAHPISGVTIVVKRFNRVILRWHVRAEDNPATLPSDLNLSGSSERQPRRAISPDATQFRALEQEATLSAIQFCEIPQDRHRLERSEVD